MPIIIASVHMKEFAMVLRVILVKGLKHLQRAPTYTDGVLANIVAFGEIRKVRRTPNYTIIGGKKEV